MGYGFDQNILYTQMKISLTKKNIYKKEKKPQEIINTKCKFKERKEMESQSDIPKTRNPQAWSWKV